MTGSVWKRSITKYEKLKSTIFGYRVNRASLIAIIYQFKCLLQSWKYLVPNSSVCFVCGFFSHSVLSCQVRNIKTNRFLNRFDRLKNNWQRFLYTLKNKYFGTFKSNQIFLFFARATSYMFNLYRYRNETQEHFNYSIVAFAKFQR